MVSACCVPALLGLTGCGTVVTTHRTHARAPAVMGEVKTAGAPSPQIVLNQLGAGGVREQRHDWTETARTSSEEWLAMHRPGEIVVLAEPADREDLVELLREVRALYAVIDANLIVFGDPVLGPPTARNRFEHSVGSIDGLCDALGVDALLLIQGIDDYFTADRKALVVLGFVAAAFTGVYVTPASGLAHVSAALIARDGTILWRDELRHGGIEDLRTPEGVQKTLTRLLRKLPRGSGPAA